MKVRMTKQRKSVLERLGSVGLSWGYGEHGGKEYFFSDGGVASQGVVEGMIKNGLLEIEQTPLGLGQNITKKAQ